MKVLLVFSWLLVSLCASQSQAAPGCPKLVSMSCSCPNFPDYCITTGSKKFTYYKIGKNLVDYVAPSAGVNLQVVEGGSVDNVRKMRWQNGVKFAIVQSDVLEHFRSLERQGHPDAADLLHPLRVILPLYNEEVHLIARTDSGINNFRDLRNKKIALGKRGGGSAMTGVAMYRYMFDEPISVRNMYFSGFDDALKAVVDRKVDAWIMVVGQPTSNFEKISSAAKKLIKLVEFDVSNSVESKILNGPYFEAKIWAGSYQWVDRDVATITVKAFLITQKYQRKSTRRKITQFTTSLCKNFPTLQRRGHPKWKEVELADRSLPGGWEYSEDVMLAFRSRDCRRNMEAVSQRDNPRSPSCPPEYTVLGLSCD